MIGILHTFFNSSTSSVLRTEYSRESTTASLAIRLISNSSLVWDIVEFCLTIHADSVDWSVDFLLRIRSRFTGTRLGDEVDDDGDGVRPELVLRAWNEREEDIDDDWGI
jgi:hypothetical protein